MKTAMQELKEYIEQHGSVVPLDQERIYDKVIELLAEERKQIEEAYKQGVWSELIPAYEYYDKIYNK